VSLALLGRRGTRVSLRNGVDRDDAGWLEPQDYARFWVAIREYVKAVKPEIFPLLRKVTCQQTSACGEGAPWCAKSPRESSRSILEFLPVTS
jgi:hypothetical protein